MALEADPSLVEELGLNDAEIKAAKETATEVLKEANDVEAKATDDKSIPPAETSEPDPFDTIEGLDEEVKKAVKLPQVRQFLEQNATEVEQVKAAYQTGLTNADAMLRATFMDEFPELSGLNAAQFEQGLAMLAQVDPPKFQKAMNRLGRFNQIQQAQQHIAHQQQAQNQQQFESYVRNEDARTETLAKTEGLAVDYNKIIGYWESQGLNRNQIMQLYKTNPVATSAEARLLVLKAARYDEMMKALRPRGTKELPPVTRPGTSSVQ